MQPTVITSSRWGCVASAITHPEYPRHLVDQGASARAGEAVSFCGEYLLFVDAHVITSAGIVSGREIVTTHQRECRKCNRREVERGADVVLVPTFALRRLAAGESWEDVAPVLDAQVLAMVQTA